ncbi:MAG TPA: hypothetical protein VGH27_09770 [Streptosporangiaceae bacterium]|jgi:hypothetical protein
MRRLRQHSVKSERVAVSADQSSSDQPKPTSGPKESGKSVAATPTQASPTLAEDLISRIVAAIDEWAKANKLNNLPRKVIFEQALAIMTSLYEASGRSN